jgi:hypothetical protein
MRASGTRKGSAAQVQGGRIYQRVTVPDVPALTECFSGLDLQPWMSVMAPFGTPRATPE